MKHPTVNLDNAAWRTDAACADTDPELFFADDDASVEQARQLCADCPVRAECLETALALGEMHGVWGGMPERERRRLIKQRRRERRERRRREREAA